MDQPVPSDKKQLRELNPRFRKGQTFLPEIDIAHQGCPKTAILHPVHPFNGKTLCNRFHLVDYCNEMIRWDKPQWQVSPGNLAVYTVC